MLANKVCYIALMFVTRERRFNVYWLVKIKRSKVEYVYIRELALYFNSLK